MDLTFIKEEEPVDYFLILPTEDEKDFELSETGNVNIKEEPNSDWTENEAEYTERNEHKSEPKRTDIENMTEDEDVADDSKISSKSKHKCDICSGTFKKVQNLISHRAKHSLPNFHQCNICKRFYPETRMVLHAVGHNGPPFHCPLCPKKYTSRSSWNFHMVMHDGVSYDCDICKKRFSQKGSLVAHMKVHFERKKDFECEKCHATFFRQTHLNRHIRNLHSNTPRPQFRCEICNKVFTRKDTLKDHQCSNRMSDRPKHWTCETCGKIFTKKHLHSMHVSRNCGDIKVYECDICSKSFRSKSKLLKHFASRYHSNPIHCPECDKPFCSKQQMKNHLRGKCHSSTMIEHDNQHRKKCSR